MKFYVDGQYYSIDDDKILNFPIQDSLVCLLFKKYNDKSFGIEVKNESIVINTAYKNFNKIVEIYNKPYIQFVELFDLEHLFSMMRNVIKIRNEKNYHNHVQELDNCILDLRSSKDLKYITTEFQNKFREELDFYGIL